MDCQIMMPDGTTPRPFDTSDNHDTVVFSMAVGSAYKKVLFSGGGVDLAQSFVEITDAELGKFKVFLMDQDTSAIAVKPGTYWIALMDFTDLDQPEEVREFNPILHGTVTITNLGGAPLPIA